MSEPTRIGRYQVEKLIGSGVMGDVYRAYDPSLDRRVAVRTIRLDSPLFEGDAEGLLARFMTEARAAVPLIHPNIVSVYDFGEDRNSYYLVTQYVEGKTLARRVSGGPVPPREAATLMLQACAALAAAHTAGLVHTEIKPANLMVVDRTGQLKVMDFGIPRLEIGRRVRTESVAATPRYMAPEQIRGQLADPRSDLYSLGAVYCELLTGDLGLSGGDLTVIAHQILNEEPRCVAEAEKRLGEGTAWVLRRALAKDPAKRFQAAGEMREAIELYCVGSAKPPTKLTSAARPEAPLPPPAELRAGAEGQPGKVGPSAQTGESAQGAQAGHAAPVFTPPRRAKGPDRRSALIAIALVVALAAIVGAWLKFGGGVSSDGVPGDAGLDSAAVAALAALDSAAAADSAAAPDGGPSAPTEPEVVAPAPVRLMVTVEPRSASVWVDDTLVVGAAGAVLPPGRYTVHAESEGYLPLDSDIDLTADTSIALALKPEPPKTGTIDVRASIPGRVLVDGRDRGAAPLRGLVMRPGTYAVRFVPEAGDGLAQLRTASVVAGQAATVSFEISDGLLSVGVRQPRWATVYAGDVRLGDTPLIEHLLPARVYQVRVERPGYIPQERLVRLEPGQHFEWVDIVLEEDRRP